MSNKGEDVKQLFAHLGLDPSTYRDIKGGGHADDHSKRERSSQAKRASKKPVVAPEDLPPPPRVQAPEERPDVPPPGRDGAPEAAAATADLAPEPADPVETGTQAGDSFDDAQTKESPPEQEREPDPVYQEADADEIEVSPDRWALLTALGNETYPVADIPEQVTELGDWSRDAGPAEEDTDRLKRAGSLAALMRGSERVVESVKRTVSDEPVPEPVDNEDSPETSGEEVTMSAEPEDTRKNRTPAEQDASARPSRGAIAKLMGRLGQPPAPRRTEAAKLKLRYERREVPVVAENQLDKSLPSVFGRLEKSRVD